MNKRAKRQTYRALSQALGNPRGMSLELRQDVLILLGGWLRQRNDPDNTKEPYLSYEMRNYLPRHNVYVEGNDALSVSAWHRHKVQAVTAARKQIGKLGHWGFEPVVRVSKNASHTTLPIMNITGGLSGADWKYITGLNYDKHVTFAVSVLYHRTVALHGVARDDKKVVQFITDHRKYPNKDVWRCQYWDFTKLGRSKDDWKKCTQHEGYVVKSDTGVVGVERSLYMATQIVNRRVVKTAIESINMDLEEEGNDQG